MALTKCTVTKGVVGALGTTPSERGLTTQQFKDKFDEEPDGTIDYINNTLTVELDTAIAAKYPLNSTLSGVNLDGVTTPGAYSYSNTCSNKPDGNSGTLQVINTGGTDFVTQQAITYSSKKLCYRTRESGVWSSWITVT